MSAEAIELMRQTYLQRLNLLIQNLSSSLFPGQKLDIAYRRGWNHEIAYEQYLQQSLESDKDKGFTQSGPHRADLKISVDDKPAQNSISRGQQKKLVCLLKIAQLMLFSEACSQRCVLLFDDLPAELDQDNQSKILSILSGLNVQVFITSIEQEQICLEHWNQYAVFHVEQGKLSV